MGDRKIKVGFIGLSGPQSWGASAHEPYFRSSRNTAYEVTALQNSSIESAKRAASTYNLSNVSCYGDPKSLANDANVDVVAVSIKVPEHYNAIVPSIEAGKDIFVEWPLAANLQEAKDLTALASQRQVRTMVGLQARQNPSILATKKLIDAGEVGDILGTTMHGYGSIFGPEHGPAQVYLQKIENGANLLTIPFGHAIDALCWVLGELNYVSATLANRRPKMRIIEDGKVLREEPKTSHDFVSVSGTLVNGGGVVNVVYEGATNPSGGPSFHWQINGTKGTILLEGKMGHVQMWQPTIKFGKAGEELKEVEVEDVMGDFSYAVGEAWQAFAGKGGGCVTTFVDALLRHQMIDAIYRSDEKGTRESYL